MLFVLFFALGAFAAWFGEDFLERHWGRAKAWTAVGVVAVLCVIALPIGAMGVVALDSFGIAELVRRHKEK